MTLEFLDRDAHRPLRLKRGMIYYRQAERHDSAVLTAPEIARTASEYPVLFQRVAGEVRPVALLSLVSEENQYLESGRWLADYVPAVVRLYPFGLAGDRVLIDPDAPMLGDEEGDALFDGDGQPTDVLKDITGMLGKYRAAQEMTRRFCERLELLEILVERSANVESPKGHRYAIEGFLMVDEEKLRALDDAALASLVRDGSIQIILSHLASLDKLLGLARRRDDGRNGKPLSAHDGA